MALTKTQQRAVRQIITRLSQQNGGCHNGPGTDALVAEANAKGMEVMSRLYLDTWILPELANLLPKE